MSSIEKGVPIEFKRMVGGCLDLLRDAAERDQALDVVVANASILADSYPFRDRKKTQQRFISSAFKIAKKMHDTGKPGPEGEYV